MELRIPCTFVASPSGALSSFRGRQVRSKPKCLARRPELQAAPRRAACTPVMKVYDVEILFHGETYTIPIDENQTLLEGIESVGLSVPYSCRAGVCMTCAAKIVQGDVDLGEIAMMDDLKDDGYVLTCSGMPRGEGIKLEMEQFDDVYDRQYGQYEIKA